MHRETVSPAALFDAAVNPGREHMIEDLGLEVVARPGMASPMEASPGLIAVRRGEQRLGVLLAVERVADRAQLEAEGIPCEGYGDGVFIEVDRGPAGRRGLRIAGPERMLAQDVVLLQEQWPTRPRPRPRPAEETEPTPLATLLAAVCALHRRRTRTVREEYLRSLLRPDAGEPPMRDDVQRALEELERRQAALPAGRDPTSARSAIIDELAARLLAAGERRFILDPERSTLELLEPAERDRYLGFSWHENDFPGGPRGPNEAHADRLFAALTRLRPERRANSGDTAAVRAAEFDAAMQRRMQDALVAVPGERGQRLHRDASAAYVEMRTAAAAEGVTLSINNSYRSAARAQASAARAGNRAAVASFSSHTLGLGIDLNMSHGALRLAEVSTRPFSNLVNMYKSPVHKWVFLRGETHGWFPYRREPWHWEYNPPGFRERLRRPAAAGTTPTPGAAPAPATPSIPPTPATPTPAPPAGGSSEVTAVAEAITDPIPPSRTPLAITGTVGRGGRNNAADVLAVQNRLVELRAADAATIAPERPSGTAAIPETSLPRTIEAIESFQRQMGIAVKGTVGLRGTSRTELDRAIPVPTQAEFTAVANERQTIGQTVSRGLTIAGAVGATTTGNAVEDVRAIQRRLVELGKLSASHGESPAADATGTVPQSRLTATIAALRSIQNDVRFFLRRRTIAGPLTPGVVSPGDATAAFLERVSVYNMTLGSNRLSLRDHVVSGVTQSETGVAFRGTAAPSALARSVFEGQGLTAGQAAALKLVSTFEGNFDAINTYDRAIVSVGFIQFAGGRGLPPYIALLKARQAAKFRDLLQKFGIDVEFTVSGGAITGARVVVLDPAGARVLRATAAETAIRDDKRLTTALILSGRDRDVQLVQIEAAIRGYVLPALNATVAPSTRGGRVRLGDVMRSQKGMAALFDRAIQEGLGGATRRFERVIQRIVRSAEPQPPTPPPPPPTAPQLQSREGDILAELERDLQAATDVGANIRRARTSLQTVMRAAGAAGATGASVTAHPELSAARGAVTAARVGVPDVVNVSTSGNVDNQLRTIRATLVAEEGRLAFTPPPASVADLSTALTASQQALENIAGSFATAPMFLGRIQRIRRSTLDSGLAESV